MRRRVLLLVAATTSLVLVAFLVPLALLVRTVATERAVLAATADAQALTALVAVADPASLAVAVAQVDATSPSQVSVFTADGAVLGAPAPRTPLVELAARGSSASGAVDGGREIVFAVRDPAGRTGVIRTFVTDAALTAGVGRAWLLLAGLGVVLLAVGLLVADRLARRLVRATIDVAAVSHRLARGELDARADPAAPVEVGVVAGALNTLAGRISELLREERETVADLSHRVRTPLTALRLDAEALRQPEDAARIGAGVDAVQRAVSSVIDAARRRATDTAECDAAVVVAERVAFWSVLAEDTERDVRTDLATGPLPVAAGRADLEALVDALLGNVFAHTPDGSAFAVRLGPRPGGGARLLVADAGPGLPAGADVLRRGASGGGSTGLGLDIARRTAEQAGGGLTLGRSPEGGLAVTVNLGPAARP
ncbi:sensor histidine kinase [Pseudonocardia charpentierae]|uniref:Signal transduction histidine-protein kinase/phosphatase MprB n=1 Tax=Pseudonocardia charpentierae TaxID=3075545 RepID=A0ABU2NBJ4_9PSEU|nr:HAMP domain-containing sensor histidine kinase [Pseudonocardia sp. DSM 45834]MDT0351321.1 HAMP domain-containing sensor histidine kinase [Pseudonocardia sp. DSM 45834]